MTHDVYLDVSDANGAAFFSRGIEGKVVMLNLLRLRETADYSEFPDLAPPKPISGRAAYQRYIEHTQPYLEASGGQVLFLGEGGTYLIGPIGEGWDLVMLVEQRSPEDFLAFASNEGYLAGIGHRVAAVHDSRILPLVEVEIGT